MQESHREIKKNLNNRHMVIINYMKENADREFTARELAVALFKEGLTVSPERNQTHPRLNELEKLGRVRIAGTVKDDVTNRKVSTYSLI